MKSVEYLREIREADGLKNAVLVKIEAAGDIITFRLHTDCMYTDADVEHACAVTARYMPAGYKADVRVMKSVPNADAVKAFLLEKLKNMYPAVAAFVSPEDVAVEAGKGGGSFVIGAAEVLRSGRRRTAFRMRSPTCFAAKRRAISAAAGRGNSARSKKIWAKSFLRKRWKNTS